MSVVPELEHLIVVPHPFVHSHTRAAAGQNLWKVCAVAGS